MSQERYVTDVLGTDNVKRVHEDVHELLELGLVEHGEGGGVVCPFATVHIDTELRSAA